MNIRMYVHIITYNCVAEESRTISLPTLSINIMEIFSKIDFQYAAIVITTDIDAKMHEAMMRYLAVRSHCKFCSCKFSHQCCWWCSSCCCLVASPSCEQVCQRPTSTNLGVSSVLPPTCFTCMKKNHACALIAILMQIRHPVSNIKIHIFRNDVTSIMVSLTADLTQTKNDN